MGFFYFDGSIHPQAGFILGAFAYSESDLDNDVADALLRVKLQPGVDEFKSGSRMDRNAAQANARPLLKAIVRDRCQIGIIITAEKNRLTLGAEALRGLHKIINANELDGNAHGVYFDQGIFPNLSQAPEMVRQNCPNQNCTFHFEQNSVAVKGLQIADLIAHTCATMLLSELGLVKKMVKAGKNSGYDPHSEMELDFELWAGLRHNFFAAGPPPYESWTSQLDFQVDVESRGLYIADSCDAKVRQAAISRFGKMYLGCIH
jgi:hypothetical protein